MFEFVKKRKIFFAISISVIVLGLIFTAIFGVGLDVSFKGGAILTYSSTAADASDADIKSIVKEVTGYDCTLGTSQDFATKVESITITVSSKDGLSVDQQSALTDKLNEKFGADTFTLASSTNVNSSMGREFLLKCLIAALFALIVIVIYVGIRFKNIGGLSAGVFALIALAHDVSIVFFSFVVLGFQINANFIAVILTILGYSLNGTIVVYDRIRENETLYGKKMSFAEIANNSINQSVRRTINTTFTTAVALIAMTVISYIFNLESIRTFSLPLLIGVICGCYTSLCIAGPLWVSWQESKSKRSVGKPQPAKSKKK